MFEPVKHRTAGVVQNQNGGRERLTHSKEGNGHELEAPVCSGLHGGLIGALDRHGNHGCSARSLGSGPAGCPQARERPCRKSSKHSSHKQERDEHARKGAAKRSTKTEPNQSDSLPKFAQIKFTTLRT